MSCKKERSPAARIVWAMGSILIWIGANALVYLFITAMESDRVRGDAVFSFSPLAHPVICLVLLSGNIILLGFILMAKSDESTE